MLESQLKKRCATWLTTNYQESALVHLGAKGRNGFPDSFAVIPLEKYNFKKSLVVLVEFKRVGKRPTVQQLNWLSYLRGVGVPAFWTDNQQQFETEIKWYLTHFV